MFVLPSLSDPSPLSAVEAAAAQLPLLLSTRAGNCDDLVVDGRNGYAALAVEIANIPEAIRGYGHIKEKAVKDAKVQEAELLKAWNDPTKAALWNAKQAAE